jgi:hypothetical protein
MQRSLTPPQSVTDHISTDSSMIEQTTELRLRILEYIHDAKIPDMAHFRESAVQTARVPTKDLLTMRTQSARMLRHYSFNGNRVSVSPSLAKATLRRAHTTPTNVLTANLQPDEERADTLAHSSMGSPMTRTTTLNSLKALKASASLNPV